MRLQRTLFSSDCRVVSCAAESHSMKGIYYKVLCIFNLLKAKEVNYMCANRGEGNRRRIESEGEGRPQQLDNMRLQQQQAHELGPNIRQHSRQ